MCSSQEMGMWGYRSELLAWLVCPGASLLVLLSPGVLSRYQESPQHKADLWVATGQGARPDPQQTHFIQRGPRFPLVSTLTLLVRFVKEGKSLS